MRVAAMGPSGDLSFHFENELVTRELRFPGLGRFGTPEECAQAVMMVIGNAYMTGQTVFLDGGHSAG